MIANTIKKLPATLLEIKKLQNKILRDFHTGYPGINRTKSLMRSYVYWPKMDNDIADMIEKCKGCALAAKAPPNLGQK